MVWMSADQLLFGRNAGGEISVGYILAVLLLTQVCAALCGLAGAA